MAIPTKNIVIVGGSSTGLMHGIVLKRLGHNVHILEQNTKSERADLAAGITTHPQFDEFVNRHDLTKQPWSIHCNSVQFLAKDSKVKRRMERALEMTSWAVIYHRLRANFDAYASSFCPDPPKPTSNDGIVMFDLGKRATALTPNAEGVSISFEDILKNEQGVIQADLVILADGASSSLRSSLFPSLERKYAGYVALRGTVIESDVSEHCQKVFDPNLTYYSFPNSYILLYIIPGANGSLKQGYRRYNWVWYYQVDQGSEEFKSLMTDTSGNVHRNTLPAGSMNPKVWDHYRDIAQKEMCAPFAELVAQTTNPFVTAIGDVSCPRATALDERVFIAGEALNLMRPHLALSTTQSAVHALALERYFRGEITLKQWEQEVLKFGRINAAKTNAFGTFFLYGYISAFGWGLNVLKAMLFNA